MRQAQTMWWGGGVAGLAIWLGTAMAVSGGTGLQAQGAQAPTFHKDVLPILQKNCQSCHRPGQVGPMSLLTYETARPYARAIKAKVVARQMPPWLADPHYNQFQNDRRLSDHDLDTLVRWVDGGALPGDPKDAPPAVNWPPDGWVIQPDVIVYGTPYTVPTKGTIEYINLTVPTGFTKDTWITSMEIRPSSGAFGVAHHICGTFIAHEDGDQHGVLDIPDPKPRDKDGALIQQTPAKRPPVNILGQFDCYLPGSLPIDYRPYKAARLIPAGTDIRLVMHYTPNGKETTDRPMVGFTIAKEKPERQYIQLGLAGPSDKGKFAIPPQTPNYEAPTAQATFLEDVELIWVAHHMHARGKDATTTLTYPDGRSDVFLKEYYNYNWQILYESVKPWKLPKGTKVRVEGHFDNSANNKLNPDPSLWVYWGEQTWEEMFGNNMGVLAPLSVDAKKVIKIESGPSRPVETIQSAAAQ